MPRNGIAPVRHFIAAGQRDLQVDDIVCVLEAKRIPYGYWFLGRVTEVHYGKDDLVRSVTVLVNGRLLRRNLRHLVPLAEPSENSTEAATPAQ